MSTYTGGGGGNEHIRRRGGGGNEHIHRRGGNEYIHRRRGVMSTYTVYN